MVLPDKVNIVQGDSYIFAFDTHWPASPKQGWSATVDAEIALGGLTNNTYRQSAKLDLTANRYPIYLAEMTVEFDTDSTAGTYVSVFAGYSHSATAGTGNPAGLSGTDAAYTGYGGATLVEDCIAQLQSIGRLPLINANDADAAPQVGEIGWFRPSKRYMMLVVHNGGGATMGSSGGTADEIAIRITGYDYQIVD